MQKEKTLISQSACIYRIAEILTKENISGKILYISGPVTDSMYGEIVKEQIEKVGILKIGSVNNNSISYAMSIAERIIATDVNCIVGMGGGKVLDVCKYASYISKIPFLSIPTTVANDGIASPIAVLKREDGKPKSLGCAMPSMILLDLDIIANSPVQMIKAGIGDIVSNYTALMDWELACKKGKDTMNGYAKLMSQNALDALMNTQIHSITPEFIKVLVNSMVLSGIAMDFAGSSRPVSGAEHLFSHALDYYSATKNLHGIQTALGVVAVLCLTDKDISAVKNYLDRFEVDINPVHLGISEETFVYCFKKAPEMRPSRYTCLNEADLGQAKIEHVYERLTKEF